MEIDIQVDEEFFYNLSTYQKLKQGQVKQPIKTQTTKKIQTQNNIYDPRNITKMFTTPFFQKQKQTEKLPEIEQKRQEFENQNKYIRDSYKRMYQETQGAISDNLLPDQQRQDEKMSVLKRSLYYDTQCKDFHQDLTRCLRYNGNREMCLREFDNFKVCILISQGQDQDINYQ